MKTEIAAICDAATDQGGKLNMLGVFDYIEANLPVVIPRCSIVFRIRYARSEIGKHQLRVTLENPGNFSTDRDFRLFFAFFNSHGLGCSESHFKSESLSR